MFDLFKRVLKQLWCRAKQAAMKAIGVAKSIFRFCTATRLRRNLSIALVLTSGLATVGWLTGIFAAAHAYVSMGFLGQAMVTAGGVTLLGMFLTATQFGVSTGGGGVLMLYSLATGQYVVALFSGVLTLLSVAGLAGLGVWAVATILHAPNWVVLALAFCYSHPVIAFLCSFAAIFAALYVVEYVLKLAFLLARLVWQSIARRNVHLLPAPV